jgi:Icc-related predicted phosphoesterase
VFNALSQGQKAVDQLNKKLDIDKMEDIKEKMDDLRADMEEKNEFFINAAKVEDDDELLNELEELEAEMAADELEKVEIGSGAIEAKGGALQQKQQQQVAAGKSEEDELKDLEMMMA